MQAHYYVTHNESEFVTETLLKYSGSMSLLLHEMLVSEAWRKFVLVPEYLTAKDLIADGNVTKVYTIVYNESVVVQLMEVVMYDRQACLQLGDDAIDLVDYCARNLLYLNTMYENSQIH